MKKKKEKIEEIIAGFFVSILLIGIGYLSAIINGLYDAEFRQMFIPFKLLFLWFLGLVSVMVIAAIISAPFAFVVSPGLVIEAAEAARRKERKERQEKETKQ